MNEELKKEDSTETNRLTEHPSMADQPRIEKTSSGKSGIILGCVAIVISLIGLSAKSDQAIPLKNQDRLSGIEEQGMMIGQQTSTLKQQIASLTSQLNKLGDELNNSRENLIREKLQKTLARVQEIGQLVNPETREKLTEVENILNKIIKPTTSTGIHITVEPAEAETTNTPLESAPQITPTDSADAAAETVAPSIDDAGPQTF
ncbi:MAG: hypothetical protein Q9M31_06820 [Mariprofundus sp.]|nr:hypothetical protein [Mariprofundus sp.]